MIDHVRLCHCGLHHIPIGVDGIGWYWSRHTEMICYMTEPDGPCWCGNAKSMHWNGHAPRGIVIDRPGATDEQREWTLKRMRELKAGGS